MLDTPGNGITVQSNKGLQGSFYYVTNQITISSNYVQGNKGAGIAFVDSELSIATNNTVIGLGFCITQLNTKKNIVRGNTCVGGLGLKLVNSPDLVSDIVATTTLDSANGAYQSSVFVGLVILFTIGGV